MIFEEEFVVRAPVETVWSFLLDVPSVGPCIPGASVDRVLEEGRCYAGSLQIRVGPISARFTGIMTVEALDCDQLVASFRAEGRDQRIGGQVSISMVLSVGPKEGEGAIVRTRADLHLTGVIGQFGRGVIQDIAKRTFAQFARNVQAVIEGKRTGAPSRGVAPSA